MFRGRFQHTVDPKGRLSIPAKFRDVLAQYGGSLVVVPNEHCLEVHPLEEWEKIEGRLREKSIFDPDVRDFARLYVSRARDAALDAAGRILLPPDTRQEAAIHKNVTLVGGGLTRFEVWDRGRFEEYARNGVENLKSLLPKISALGV
jgi:transcriptional regulator MraZ